ncbi:MAG: FecR family protein [Ginsengibacter sp.]
MKKDYFIELLRKYQQGILTNEEEQFIISYYNLFQNNSDVMEMLTSEQKEELKNNIQNSIWRNILKNKISDEKIRFINRVYVRISAAAVVFIIVFASLFYVFNESSSEHNHDAIAKNQKQNIVNSSHDALPGSNKATLTLADGSVIDLDSAKNGTLIRQGNIKIIKGDDGQILYDLDQKKSDGAGYNTISTPRGGKYEIVLSDGSKVWLNAASSLKYPASFSGKIREVTLTGEGYFEVAKNALMPFHVKVNDMTIEVLGTHFNVNAYDDESVVATTLLEGSVKIRSGLSPSSVNQTIMLTPGEQADLTKTGRLKINRHANTEEAVAWTNDNFEFNNADIPDIMRQLSRWYDVEVEYNGFIPNRRFTGKISRNLSLSQVIGMLQYTGVSMEIVNKKITISEN